MQPWFIWNNIDSRTMNVWVSQLPAPTRAAERVQEIEIPGRAGTLTIKEGDDVHEGYVKECVITVPATADFHALLNWLRGESQVIFSNEPDRVYFAHMAGQVKFDRVGNSLKQATLPIYVHPHKGQYPPEYDIAIDGSETVRNPGNVAAKPIITLTFVGSCTLTVNGETMMFTKGNETTAQTIIVDCDAEIVTSDANIWSGGVEGEFPRLPVGDNTISAALTVPTWENDKEYTQGHLRVYDGDIYECGITARAWVATKEYASGDYCINNDNLYQANKTTSSSWVAADWDLVGTSTEWIDDLWTLVAEATVTAILKPRWRWC